MNRALLKEFIKQKELLLLEGELTLEWLGKKGLEQAVPEQEQALDDLRSFIEFIKTK